MVKEYCYYIRYFDEFGSVVHTDTYTVPATNSDDAYIEVSKHADKYADENDCQYEASLEDVC